MIYKFYMMALMLVLEISLVEARGGSHHRYFSLTQKGYDPFYQTNFANLKEVEDTEIYVMEFFENELNDQEEALKKEIKRV